MLLIDDFLDQTSERLRKKILDTPFVAGSTAATGRAAKVKNNLQMDRDRGRKILDDVALRLMTNEQVELYAIPNRIAAMSVSGDDVGMEYGSDECRKVHCLKLWPGRGVSSKHRG